MSALAWGLVIRPGSVLARAANLPRVGFVLTTAPLATMMGTEPQETVIRAFVQRLRSLGYVEGRNVSIERRSAEGNLGRLKGLIQELADMPVDVIVVTGDYMVSRAKEVTSTVPIVVAGMTVPVALKLVSSLARPGGNLTGLVSALGNPDFTAKRLEIVRDMLPKASRVAFLGLKDSWDIEASEARVAAPAMGITLRLAEVQLPDIQPALDPLARERPDAILVSSDPPFFVNRRLITTFAARLHVPDFHAYHLAVEGGALASYGHDSNEIFGRTAGYVDRILKGAKPADLPLELIERYALTVNLKTARALGLTIPHAVLVRADRLID